MYSSLYSWNIEKYPIHFITTICPKSLPILCINLLCEIGQEVLDIEYIIYPTDDFFFNSNNCSYLFYKLKESKILVDVHSY